ncbi:MAG: hypothetical protein ACKO7W_02295 [Elainella sp.]
MADKTLPELNRADLDWLTQAGQLLELIPGQVLLEADQPVDQLLLVLDGELELELPALGTTPAELLGRLGRGDLTGALLPDSRPLAYRLLAVRTGRASVLAIPQASVLTRAQREPEFGARLFGSVALALAHQHSQFVAALSQQHRLPPLFVPKSIFSVFSSLQDTDICWMLGAGSLQRLAVGTICVAEGKPLAALYITLKGSLTVWMNTETIAQNTAQSIGQNATLNIGHNPDQRPLLAARAAPGTTIGTRLPETAAERAVSQILPGELVGLSQFLDLGPAHYTIRANPDALVLTLPLAVLQSKLQQDSGFAARFYRAAASLMAERTTQLLGALHYQDRCYECGDSLCTDQSYDDELALDELQQTSLARARFSWMLRQLNIKD